MKRNTMQTPSELVRLGFEPAYLALLTCAGLKPMSRIENCSNPDHQRVLQTSGLKTRVIHRWTRSGERIPEIIFARSGEVLSEYAARFHDKTLERTPDDMRFEGRMFGYPTCCIESYISRGYAPNSLCRADQSILFHWACNGCKVTPKLLPEYRRVYRRCRQLFSGKPDVCIRPPRPISSRYVKRSLALATSVAAALALPQTVLHGSSSMPPTDPHWLQLGPEVDPDRDLLTAEEEIVLGTNPAQPDQNQNAVPDGTDLAFELADMIAFLPTVASNTEPYAIHNMAFGLETCKVCGETANMGFITIVNPLENQIIHIPYIGLHYLEHGSFQFDGTVHSGRVNPPLLRTVLTSDGRRHFISEPEAYDSDNDGLRDWEEPFLGTNPNKTDSNDNLVIDGAETMRAFRAALEQLPRAVSPETGPKDTPFIVEHPMKGIETCPRCGEQVAMNIWDVINPVTHAKMSIPSMALHYLEHCGPSWEGGQLMGGKGRVEPLRLQGLLSGQLDGHWLEVQSDIDSDLLSDQEEVDIGTDPRCTDHDKNQVPDGADLARATADEIEALPTVPTPAVYRLDFKLRGLEQCEICGDTVNMGHLTVCNTAAGLYAKVPYISLHYLHHGSFSFAGDVHGTGRLEVILLINALHSKGPSHLLPTSGDADQDGLTDFEEPRLGFDKSRPDSDDDGVPDGFWLARKMFSEIQALSRTPNQTCFAVENPLRGIVTCDVCGTNVNMGWLDIINPPEQLKVRITYLALHFLDHGSFASSPGSRLNPCLLDIALHGDGSSHLVTWKGDSDSDGLLDGEETYFGTRPDRPDTDSDGVLDGITIARQLYQKVQALPVGRNQSGRYRLLYETDCIAPCPVCGESVNCGHIEVVSEWAGKSVRISFLNLHYLEHGSLAVSQSERIDPVALDALLRPIPSIALTAEGLTLRWPSCTEKTYQVFTSLNVLGPWLPGPVLSGTGEELSFTDPDITAPLKLYQVRMN